MSSATIEVGAGVEVAGLTGPLEKSPGIGPPRLDHPLAMQGQGGGVLPVGEQPTQHLDARAVEAVVEVEQKAPETGRGDAAAP